MPFFNPYKLIVFVFLMLPMIGTAQNPGIAQHTSNQKNSKPVELFDDESVLELTLRGNLKELFNDRDEKSSDHDLFVDYANTDSVKTSLKVRAKTRGHFRKLRSNCYYPPLLLNFQKSATKEASIFGNVDKLKLVMPCVGDDYVIREWLVYKLYNLVTPVSLKARLVKINLDDQKARKNPKPFYGILLEEEKKMAKRCDAVCVERKLNPEQTAPEAFLSMAVFQYLVGNTDWSVQFNQNIFFVSKDELTAVTTVPYDFDHAGLVNAPYANPAPELKLGSILERRYRGYCVDDMLSFENVFLKYNHLKEKIYKLYENCTLIDDRYRKFVKRFFDDFYEVINDPGLAKKAFTYPCDKSGTGNVIIKGMKSD